MTPRPSATPRPTATPKPSAHAEAQATPKPTATPKPSATPKPTATPKPKPSPTPVPDSIPIREARDTAIGESVTVTGTVTVEPGRYLGKDVFVVQDGSGAVAVKAPAGDIASEFARGRIVTVTGELAAPYGNLEVRPRAREDLAVIGQGGLPEPATITTSDLGEAIEGDLVSITGTIAEIDRGSAGTLTITITDRDEMARSTSTRRSVRPHPSSSRGQSVRCHRHRRSAGITERCCGRLPSLAARRRRHPDRLPAAQGDRATR